MNRIMGDSTVLDDIPLDVEIAATYVNGRYAVSLNALEARFPHHAYGHCRIDVDGSRPDADMRDWEPGDYGGDLEIWVKDHNGHTGKKDAVIYCDRNDIPGVREGTKSQVLGKDYFMVVAMLNGEMYEAPGVVGCQRDGANQTGSNWDRTFVNKDSLWLPIRLVGKPNCTALERALRVAVSNMWTNVLDKHANAVIRASHPHPVFPSGVKFTQMVVGTVEDGIWGPNSKAALKVTVTAVQNSLLLMGYSPKGVDGIWGPNTQEAYKKARLICHD